MQATTYSRWWASLIPARNTLHETGSYETPGIAGPLCRTLSPSRSFTDVGAGSASTTTPRSLRPATDAANPHRALSHAWTEPAAASESDTRGLDVPRLRDGTAAAPGPGARELLGRGIKRASDSLRSQLLTPRDAVPTLRTVHGHGGRDLTDLRRIWRGFKR